MNQRNGFTPATNEEQASAITGRFTGKLVIGCIIAVALMAVVAPQLWKVAGSHFGKRSTTSIGLDWQEIHRLNQTIAPGSSGQGRYGDDGCGDPPHGPGGTVEGSQVKPASGWKGADPSGAGWTAPPGQRAPRRV